jgi:hypothetical protein
MTVRRLNVKAIGGFVVIFLIVLVIIVDTNLTGDSEGHRNDVGSR